MPMFQRKNYFDIVCYFLVFQHFFSLRNTVTVSKPQQVSETVRTGVDRGPEGVTKCQSEKVEYKVRNLSLYFFQNGPPRPDLSRMSKTTVSQSPILLVSLPYKATAFSHVCSQEQIVFCTSQEDSQYTVSTLLGHLPEKEHS